MNNNLKKVTTTVYPSEYNFVLEITTLCPLCNHSSNPTIIYSYGYNKIGYMSEYSILSFCENCNGTFIMIGEYNSQNNTANFKGSFPKKPIKSDFSKRINSISEEFQIIFNQSEEVESLGYNHLAGIGYRKALEFIITDYLIFLNKDDPDEIQILSKPNTTLNQKIMKIDNSKIKDTSKAASWIGNDETHYSKRHEDKDINDLKTYLNTVIYFIDFDLSTYDASDFINP